MDFLVNGVNKTVRHGSVDYHIQIEDFGPEHHYLLSRVYDAGRILWQKKVAYDPAVAACKTDQERKEILTQQIDKLVATLEAAIAQGKFAGNPK